MLVVVAGHSRRVGKSSLIASLIRHFAKREWTALKISPHRHRAPGDTFLLTAEAATHRFREAGAREAYLLRAPDDQVAAAVESLRWLGDPARHVVAESNRLVSLRRPDLLLFACDPANADWKESSAICVPRADAMVVMGAPDDARLAGLDAPRFRVESPDHWSGELEQWLRERFALIDTRRT